MTDIATPTSRRTALICSVIAGVVLAAMAFDTTVVKIGSDADVRKQAFSADAFGAGEFPRLQAAIEAAAVDGLELGAAVMADKAAAAKKYGTASSTGALMSVKLVGVLGDVRSGVYDVKVAGLPADIRVRLQTGPAINGTDLRDATGDIAFGSFKNQIEYQDAGSGINRAMKVAILDPIDTASLAGKSVEVVGAFRLINPKNWLITPVRITVK